MNLGLASTNHAQALRDYAKAGDLLVKNGTFVTLADVNDTFLARAGITGWRHQIECTTCISLPSLRG
jgi:peptide/nickel transport system substrate-binding protein